MLRPEVPGRLPRPDPGAVQKWPIATEHSTHIKSRVVRMSIAYTYTNGREYASRKGGRHSADWADPPLHRSGVRVSGRAGAQRRAQRMLIDWFGIWDLTPPRLSRHCQASYAPGYLSLTVLTRARSRDDLGIRARSKRDTTPQSTPSERMRDSAVGTREGEIDRMAPVSAGASRRIGGGR